MNEHERTPKEIIDDVLSRWTVTDLKEMSDDDLDRGLSQIGDSFRGLSTVRSGVVNLISFWDIDSTSGNTYQVRRFENFVWCSCLDHFFTKTVCRHIAFTTKDFTRKRANEMDRSPYLKNTNERRPERIGSVRI
jgi:hypothetical protein